MDHSPIRRPHFFFTTAALPCPYIGGRMERKIVTELSGPDAVRLHDTLSRAGFRRSHSIAYAPACPGCSACVPVRVVVKDFSPNRSFRRTMRVNADLTATIAPARATAEQYRLFRNYQEHRHGGSDMALMGFYDYRSMVEDSPIDTNLLEFRSADGTLIAVCLIDTMDDGLSAVYSFFDTEQPQRQGLGTYIVLWLINEAKRRSLPFVYLGYWISDSPKMSYKIKYAPLEAFGAGGWSALKAPNQGDAASSE